MKKVRSPPVLSEETEARGHLACMSMFEHVTVQHVLEARRGLRASFTFSIGLGRQGIQPEPLPLLYPPSFPVLPPALLSQNHVSLACSVA